MFLETKKEVINWLDAMRIKNYTVFDLKDFPIDVDGHVNISGKLLGEIPVNFRTVNGCFDCSENLLTSLQGSPSTVQDFLCNNNELTSLKFSPKKIDGNFDCSVNKLTFLNHSPQEISGSYYCYGNKLLSLVGAPKIIPGNFNCANNQLTSLIGVPEEIHASFSCGSNKIENLDYFPKLINDDIELSKNKLTSIALKAILNTTPGRHLFIQENNITTLDYLPKNITHLWCDKNNISYQGFKNFPNLVELSCNNLIDLNDSEVYRFVGEEKVQDYLHTVNAHYEKEQFEKDILDSNKPAKKTKL
jgi:hypothetical protein